jgi:hypothetical protein
VARQTLWSPEEGESVFSDNVLWFLLPVVVQDAFSFLLYCLSWTHVGKGLNWNMKLMVMTFQLFWSEFHWMWFAISILPEVTDRHYLNSKSQLMDVKWEINCQPKYFCCHWQPAVVEICCELVVWWKVLHSCMMYVEIWNCKCRTSDQIHLCNALYLSLESTCSCI